MIIIPKKILVTDIAGFLGSNLLSKLIKEGHHDVGFDNLSMGSMQNIGDNLNHENFDFLEKDIFEQSTKDGWENDFDIRTKQQLKLIL